MFNEGESYYDNDDDDNDDDDDDDDDDDKYTLTGAHNPERETSILALCHGVFTNQFVFRYIEGHFFPRK